MEICLNMFRMSHSPIWHYICHEYSPLMKNNNSNDDEWDNDANVYFLRCFFSSFHALTEGLTRASDNIQSTERERHRLSRIALCFLLNDLRMLVGTIPKIEKNEKK